jgi:hypothetical protein
VGVVLCLNPNRAREVHSPYNISNLRAPAISTIAPLMNLPKAATSVTVDVKRDANIEDDDMTFCSLLLFDDDDPPPLFVVRIRNGIHLFLIPFLSYTSNI